MKICAKCKLQKGDGDFYPSHPRWCKSCLKVNYLTWQKNNPEKIGAMVRRWRVRHPEKYQAIVRAASARMSKRRWKEHPEKAQAYWDVHHAVKKGVLVKPEKCTICNTKKPLEGHHADYSKPLEVIWCCRQCHRKTFHSGQVVV
jgi:hypothetical protein